MLTNPVYSQNVIQLPSIDDPRLAPYRDLPRRESSPEDTFIAEGRFVVDRLIESDYVIESLLLESGNEEEYASRVAEDVPIFCLPPAAIKYLVNNTRSPSLASSDSHAAAKSRPGPSRHSLISVVLP